MVLHAPLSPFASMDDATGLMIRVVPVAAIALLVLVPPVVPNGFYEANVLIGPYGANGSINLVVASKAYMALVVLSLLWLLRLLGLLKHLWRYWL